MAKPEEQMYNYQTKCHRKRKGFSSFVCLHNSYQTHLEEKEEVAIPRKAMSTLVNYGEKKEKVQGVGCFLHKRRKFK